MVLSIESFHATSILELTCGLGSPCTETAHPNTHASNFMQEPYVSISCALQPKPCFNPCSPEGFSQTYFPKGGCCNPPLDYQY